MLLLMVKQWLAGLTERHASCRSVSLLSTYILFGFSPLWRFIWETHGAIPRGSDALSLIRVNKQSGALFKYGNTLQQHNQRHCLCCCCAWGEKKERRGKKGSFGEDSHLSFINPPTPLGWNTYKSFSSCPWAGLSSGLGTDIAGCTICWQFCSLLNF